MMSDITLYIDTKTYRELVVKAGKNLDIAIEECRDFKAKKESVLVRKTLFLRKDVTAWDTLVKKSEYSPWGLWDYIHDHCEDIDKSHTWMIINRWHIEKMLNVKHEGVTEVVLTSEKHNILVKAAYIYDEKGGLDG